MTTTYVGSSGSQIVSSGSKWRLAFRQAFSLADGVKEGLSFTLYDSTLQAKARSFFDNLASSTVAYPVAQPLVGDDGSVFVVDVKLKTQLPALLSLAGVMGIVDDYAPGCDLIRVAAIPANENTTDAVGNRQAFFRDATKQDEQLDATTGITGAVNTATGAAKTAAKTVSIVAVLALLGAAAVVALKIKRR